MRRCITYSKYAMFVLQKFFFRIYPNWVPSFKLMSEFVQQICEKIVYNGDHLKK